VSRTQRREYSSWASLSTTSGWQRRSPMNHWQARDSHVTGARSVVLDELVLHKFFTEVTSWTKPWLTLCGLAKETLDMRLSGWREAWGEWTTARHFSEIGLFISWSGQSQHSIRQISSLSLSLSRWWYSTFHLCHYTWFHTQHFLQLVSLSLEQFEAWFLLVGM